LPDPDGVVDLPAGFSYRILSPQGSELRGGLVCPGNHDGMGAFAGPDGAVALVRNHELIGKLSGEVGDHVADPLPGKRPYDPAEAGCTTAVIVDSGLHQLDAYLTSSGTRLNCGGGRTPWGTWLTCEETVSEGHGYVFEVQWDDPESELSRQPILGMGRFEHEAVAHDPGSGLFYLTEDDHSDPSVSFFFRFRPDDPTPRPGALHAGGTLEALAALEGGPARWLPVDPERAHDDALDAGAARFRRLEGCTFSDGAIWFADTEGGRDGLGQIFRYVTADGRLELVFESDDDSRLDRPDNLATSPRGDLVAAEGGPGENRLLAFTSTGDIYVLARSADDLFAGPCFSPDGTTLFANLYQAGLTLAIRGPTASSL
jgi:secreted PhoX family phosphatase